MLLARIFQNKCPRCGEGDFFRFSFFKKPSKFHEMYDYCEHCGLSFHQEPGYYFGAMYVSYAINVAIMVLVWIVTALLTGEDTSIWWTVLFSVLAGLMVTPFTFRWARLIWISFFIRFEPGKTNKPGSY